MQESSVPRAASAASAASAAACLHHRIFATGSCSTGCSLGIGNIVAAGRHMCTCIRLQRVQGKGALVALSRACRVAGNMLVEATQPPKGGRLGRTGRGRGCEPLRMSKTALRTPLPAQLPVQT